MQIRLAGYVNDSIVDGPGLRFTIFSQGCNHKCKNCHNPHTHDFNGGELYDTEQLVEMIRSNPLLDGVTFSGGEPMDRAAEFSELANKLSDYSIYCFTGYLFEDLIKSENPHIMALLGKIDVLIDGPYVDEKRSLGLKFRGSANQRILDCKESVRHGKAISKDI